MIYYESLMNGIPKCIKNGLALREHK